MSYIPPQRRLKAWQRRAVKDAQASAAQARRDMYATNEGARRNRLLAESLFVEVREIEKKFLSWYPFYTETHEPVTTTAVVHVERSQTPQLDFIRMEFRISRTVWHQADTLLKELLIHDAVADIVAKALA